MRCWRFAAQAEVAADLHGRGHVELRRALSSVSTRPDWCPIIYIMSSRAPRQMARVRLSPGVTRSPRSQHRTVSAYSASTTRSAASTRRNSSWVRRPALAPSRCGSTAASCSARDACWSTRDLHLGSERRSPCRRRCRHDQPRRKRQLVGLHHDCIPGARLLMTLGFPRSAKSVHLTAHATPPCHEAPGRPPLGRSGRRPVPPLLRAASWQPCSGQPR